jgi:sugar phosphate isomerase/epimerase
MKTSRREFLKKSALGVATLSVMSESVLGMAAKGELTGVQLYSVRDDMKADPMGTLKALSAMGYKAVEHASYRERKFYSGWTAKEFKKILDDLGMAMPSGHTVLGPAHWDEAKKDFTDAWKYTVEDAAILGQQFVISPSMHGDYRKSQDALKKLMDIFNKSGELCKKSGMKFGYHNHDFEFAEKLDGVSVYEIILKNTDPNLVIQQLDIGNLYNGGANAKDVMKASEGNEKFESTILGTGIVPVKDVIDMGRKTGTIHFIIEQESYQGKTPLAAVKEDLAIMKKWGY